MCGSSICKEAAEEARVPVLLQCSTRPGLQASTLTCKECVFRWWYCCKQHLIVMSGNLYFSQMNRAISVNPPPGKSLSLKITLSDDNFKFQWNYVKGPGQVHEGKSSIEAKSGNPKVGNRIFLSTMLSMRIVIEKLNFTAHLLLESISFKWEVGSLLTIWRL